MAEEQKTHMVSLQEFPGLEEGLDGKGKIGWRVLGINKEDGTAEIVFTSMELDGGNLADKALRDMSGPGSSPKEEKSDPQTDDIG